MSHTAPAFLNRAVPAIGAEADGRLRLAALLAAYLAVWTAYAVVSHLPDVVHFDMAEAYVWGLEPQLGYYKHPPVMAWVARLWFSVFPASDWAFYLLSITNATLALFAVWLFAGEFVRDGRRLLAVAALMLTPLYSFHAIKFNANTILLSLWPLTAYAFLRAFKTRRIGWAIGFAAAAAAAVLAKYYSGLLLVGCAAAALAHPERRRYFASPAPYVTIAAFLAFVAPHLVWFARVGALPLHYAVDTRMGGDAGSLGQVLAYVFGSLAWAAPMLVALLWFGRSPGALRTPVSSPEAADRRTLAILATSCLVLPAVVGLVLGVRVGATWSIPAWFAVPLLVLAAPGLRYGPAAERRILALAALLAVGALAASPLIAYAKSRGDDPAVLEPRREFAEAATALWRSETGKPLRLVAGSERLAEYLSFYGPDHPSEFISFDVEKAPWAGAERRARAGLLAICAEADQACREEAGRIAGAPPRTLALSRRVLGRTGPEYRALVWIVAPRGAAAR